MALFSDKIKITEEYKLHWMKKISLFLQEVLKIFHHLEVLHHRSLRKFSDLSRTSYNVDNLFLYVLISCV